MPPRINGDVDPDYAGEGKVFYQDDRGINLVYTKRADAPSNLKFELSNPSCRATWDHVTNMGSDFLLYSVQAFLVKDGEVISSDVITTNANYADFTDFVNTNGAGKYYFTVQAVWDDAFASEKVKSDDTEVISTKVNIKVFDEEGVELQGEEGGAVYWGSGSGSSKLEDGERFFALASEEPLKIIEVEVSHVNIGYLFDKIEFKEDPADKSVSEDGKSVSFTMDKSYELTVSFIKSTATSAVKVELGEGHEDLAKAFAEAMQKKEEYPFSIYDISGSYEEGTSLIIDWPRASSTLYDAMEYIMDAIYEVKDDSSDERFNMSIGKKKVNEYKSNHEISSEMEAAKNEEMPEEGITLYAHWAVPAGNGSFTMQAPVCGKVVKYEQKYDEELDDTVTIAENQPVVEAEEDSTFNVLIVGDLQMARWGSMIEPENPWEDPFRPLNNVTILGGTKYKALIALEEKPGYYFDYMGGVIPLEPGMDPVDPVEQKLPEITVNGEKMEVKAQGSSLYVEYEIEAVHDWDEGEVTTKPTCEKKGIKTFTCKAEGCGATRTEDIDPIGHKYGAWEKLDDEQHQRVCENDASHVEKEAHTWDEGKVTKEPTTEAKGEKLYTCEVCKGTKTEPIPPKGPEPIPDRKGQKGEDGTAFGKGASLEAAEAALAALTSDGDPAGTKFAPLYAQSKKVTKSSAKVTWKKVSGAKKYIVYGNRCGKKYKFKKIKEVSGKSLNVKKVAGKKLKKKTNYKFLVMAVDGDNNIVSTSKVIHVITKGGKNGNYTKVKVSKPKKAKITLKKGKTTKIKAKAIGKKVKAHRKLLYESMDTTIATVGAKNGKVKTVKKGKVKINCYASNGVYKTVTVTVK